MGDRLTLLRVAVLVLLCFLTACRGGDSSLSTNPSGTGPLDVAELEPLLDAELARLGIDPDKAAAAAPSGENSLVLDLAAELTPGDGQSVPDVVELSWTGMLPGDYDQNGEVNSGDLAPLAVNFGATVEYESDPPAPVSWWPAGDPADTGGAEPGNPPAPGSGAHNWRLARIDGDHNGEINAGDVAPIAQHWMERASGYRVYRSGPDSEEYELLPNPASAASLVTRERPVLGPGMPERYTFINPLLAAGEYHYYVTPYDVETGFEGGPSPSVSVHSNAAPSIQLQAEPTEGNSPLTVNFTLSADETDGEITDYAWDFEGDGVVDLEGADLAETSHIYQTGGSYYPAVEVTDENGKLASATTNIRVDYPPIAFFSASPTHGTPPLTVAFDASGSTDPGGQITAFRWDLDGDGTYELEGAGAFVNHEFSEPGSHIVRLEVEDNDGFTDSSYRTIVLNTPPVAYFSVDDLAQTSLSIRFYADESYDPDGDDLTLEWDFEPDGTVDFESDSPEEMVIHYYDDYGEYRPTLTVSDEHNASATYFLHIRCMAPPVAEMTQDKVFGALPLTVQFDASASTDEDGMIEFYEFDFDGDGAYDTPKQAEAIAEHTYENFDAFLPRVRVTDNDGNTDEHSGSRVHTTLWRPVAEFDSVMQDSLAGGFSGLQVGNRFAVAYSTMTGGLFVQFSKEGSLEEWDPPINLRPPSNIRAEYLIEINGAPCLFFIDDDLLYMMRGEPVAGGIWSDPVQITADPVGWRPFYDVRVIDGLPYVTYYTSQSFVGPDEDGVYFVRGTNPEGTTWAYPQFIWSKPGFEPLSRLFMSAAGERPNVFFQFNSGIYMTYPLDPLFVTWTVQQANVPGGDPQMLPVQRNLDWEGFPVTCVETLDRETLYYYDESSPEGFISFEVPLDYGGIEEFYAYSMQLMDGMPHMQLSIRAPRPGAEYPVTEYHYWAEDPSLTSWDNEPICTAGYVFLKELARFDGQLLAVASPVMNAKRYILLLRD